MILLIAFLFSFQLEAGWSTQGAETAFELQSLVTTIKKKDLSQDQWSDLTKNIDLLNKNLQKISTPISLYLTKAELYTFFLGSAPKDLSTSFYRENMKLSPQGDLSVFEKWIWSAVVRDLSRLKKENSRYQTKLNLLLPWIAFFKQLPKEQRNERLIRLKIKFLTQLNKTLLSFIQIQSENASEDDNSIAFSYQEEAFKPQAETKLKPFISELDKVIKKHRSLKLPLPLDDWKVKTDDFGTYREKQERDEGQETLIDVLFEEDLPAPTDDWEL